MKKQFIILSILLLAVLFIMPFNIAKATDSIKNATTTAQCKNEKFNSYQNNFILHRPHPYFPHLNKPKEKGYIKLFKKVIEFVEFINKNVWGIIFLLWLGISLKRAIHNYKIKKKYKRDTNQYEVKRNKDEGEEKDRHSIYLVCKNKNKEDLIEYHHIINMYTLVKLGYTRPTRKEIDCFSAKDCKIGENIIIYNITLDFKNIDNNK